jgi:Ca2+-binding EF-hand superfamily protein
MKLPAVLLAALISLSPAVALADDGGGDVRILRKQMKQRMIEKYDADGDGKLTGAEKQQAKKAMKAAKRKMKKARRIAKAARREARFDRIIDRLDTNRDGLVGPEEAGERFQRLQRFDANGDGWVTREEMTLTKKQMKKQKQGKKQKLRRQHESR